MENKQSIIDAFSRAYGSAPSGTDLVTEEQKKEANVDLKTSFNRAIENSAVVLDNNPEPTQEEGVFDRLFYQPYQRAIERQVATFERAAATMGQERNIDPNQTKEQIMQGYRQRTDIPSVLLQTAANPISMAFDVAGESLLFGAENAVKWLPDGFTEDVAQAFKDFSETKMGQVAINAAMEGMEAWESFSESYPNNAANIRAFFDLSMLRGTGSLVKNTSPELKPLKIERVGMRNETKPLAGGDKDVYNILFKGQKKTPEQAMNTTGPQGIKGVQETLATAEELDLVDLAKAAGVSGNKTIQENLNSVNQYMGKLDDNLVKVLRQNEKNTNWAELDKAIRLQIKAQFDAVVESNPKLFSSKAARQEVAKDFSEFMAILDEQGGTLEGLLVSRRMFDERMGRMGVDLSGSKLTSKNLSAMAVRNAVNETMFAYAPGAQNLLAKQAQIYKILPGLTKKAIDEPATAFGRYIADLGLGHLVGDTATSKIINAGYVLGASVALSPYYVFKQAMKRPSPARGRAKVSYVLRDIKQEISKAIEATKDPVKRQSLIRDRKTVYAALNAAAKQYEKEMEEQENER